MYTASCLCGSVHLTVNSIIGLGICHCLTCRKMTSSAFSINAAIRATDVILERGAPKSVSLTADCGTKSVLKICPDCGSPLWTEWSGMPELRILKAGILDNVDGENVLEREELRPKVEQFTTRRPDWLCAVEGSLQCEGQQGARQTEDMMGDIEHGKAKKSPYELLKRKL